MNIKTRNAKLIDICYFIAMPLSRFSDTFNIPHTEGTFPHMFNVSDNYNCVGPLSALRYYDPNGMKEPLRTQLIEWHENDVFDFAKEIPEYGKADVQFLKSGCIKFRNAFITDTGIYPFQSCTIAGACLNVLCTSYPKPNSIGHVPVNGYRSLRNYSNKSMEWITYCENITGVSYRHAWSAGGEMYLKKAKACADAYYKSQRHEYVMAFIGCHFHGYQT